jgi:hypothetical protein
MKSISSAQPAGFSSHGFIQNIYVPLLLTQPELKMRITVTSALTDHNVLQKVWQEA